VSLLLSGITLPLTLAPKIIRSIAAVNPLAGEVTASRALFLGNFGDSAIVSERGRARLSRCSCFLVGDPLIQAGSRVNRRRQHGPRRDSG